MSKRFDGNFVLLGVVSFGESVCGVQSGRPGVYTNVLSHVAWIRNVVGVTHAVEQINTCTTVDGRMCQFPFIFKETHYDRLDCPQRELLREDLKNCIFFEIVIKGRGPKPNLKKKASGGGVGEMI